MRAMSTLSEVGVRPVNIARSLLVAIALLGACRSPVARADARAADDADSGPAGDGGDTSCADMSEDCVALADFGTLFTRSNGRADGTLVALLETTDSQCDLYNDDHVVLQMSILGHIQRLVVSVDDVAFATTSAALVGPAYAEGWHLNVNLDYPTDLGMHSTDFAPVTMAAATAFICADVAIGAPLSVFAYSSGEYPGSAHQVHRNDSYPDGAIVVDPTGESPKYLLFRYTSQVF
jgi:hypothetical protein